MKRAIPLAAGLLLLGTAAMPAVPKTAPKIDEKAALAKVNGDAITVHDLLDAFTSRHGGHAKFLGGNAEAREFLNLLIDDRLFLQEAYDIGLDQDETVQQVVDEFAQRKAADALVKMEIDDRSQPAEAEVRDAWKLLNVMLHVRQIAVDTREEAEDIRRSILQGGDADAFARTCSRAQSRSHGGNLVVNWGQFGPEWEKVVFALEPGEVSPVFESADAFEVVILQGRADVDLPELDKVKSQIEAVLRQRKSEERKRAFAAELWRKYDVKLLMTDFTPNGIAAAYREAPETVIATWKGGEMTIGEVFDDATVRSFASMPLPVAQREIEKRLRSTINAPLSTLEAAERKLGERPEIVAEVDEYREVLMRKALFRDHVFKDVAVSDEEVQKYYEAHKADFVAPEQRRVAHILVANERDAASARSMLDSGVDFAQLAKRLSRDFMTASSSGDLGWITQDKVPVAFKEVWTLAVGSVSSPIQSPAGWHLIKVLEIKDKRPLALGEVQEKVRASALDEKQRSVRAFWRERLRKAATIAIDDAAIRAFVAANEFTAAAPPQHTMK